MSATQKMVLISQEDAEYARLLARYRQDEWGKVGEDMPGHDQAIDIIANLELFKNRITNAIGV